MSRPVYIVSGPTCSGKTAWAEAFAKAKKCSLFNADAYQFYREIPIISNQSEEVSGWNFVAFRSIAEPLNAGDFGRLAEEKLKDFGIWVGTGLYLGSAFYGLDEERIKGVPFQKPPRRKFLAIVFDPLREELYQRINERVDQMIEKGAIDEVQRIRQLIQSGAVLRTNPVLRAIGLKHLLQHLDEGVSLSKSIEDWKRDTRRLAKRQWTWLRKFMPESAFCKWVKPSDSLLFFDQFDMKPFNDERT